MFDHSQLVLTIAPTLACNFKCKYCYETSREEIINSERMEAIYNFVEERYLTDRFKKLKINWYGGEPLLVMSKIIEMSKWLMNFSEKNDIEYTARMFSNGSLITDKTINKFKELKISDIQLTIDGLKDNHDKRRISKNSKSTYDCLINNTKKLLEMEFQ